MSKHTLLIELLNYANPELDDYTESTFDDLNILIDSPELDRPPSVVAVSSLG